MKKTMKTPKKIIKADGRNPVIRARRVIYQQYAHLQKVRLGLFNERHAARKARKLDEVQMLTEAIFHLARAQAYLNTVSRHRFACDLEDLEVYK